MGFIKKFEEWLDRKEQVWGDPETEELSGASAMQTPPQADTVNRNMNGYGAVPAQTTAGDESVQEPPGFTRARMTPAPPQKAEHTGTSAGKVDFELWPDDSKNHDGDNKETPYSDRNTADRNPGKVQPAVPVGIPQNKAVISLILDTTMSMKRIYARLYSQMMEELSALRSLKNISLSWRLSYISHEGYQFDGEMTTGELEEKLGNIALQGGSRDGYEDIIDPLRRECMALTAVEADVRGLLMLTDTSGKQPVASEEEQQEDFPLDFCILYLYQDDTNNNFDDYIAIKKTDMHHISTLLYENHLPGLKEKVTEALRHNSMG